MIFRKIPLDGKAYVIDIEPNVDNRGFFARTVCEEEFGRLGLRVEFKQQSISFNPKVGTIRGMHWQTQPSAEQKLVRVTRGAIFDVIVDIRNDSKTYKQWYAVELSSQNRRQIYIPYGFAHGFQTLEPDTEVLYEMTTPYNPKASKGFIWNDATINIVWPETADITIGPRDAQLSGFEF